MSNFMVNTNNEKLDSEADDKRKEYSHEAEDLKEYQNKLVSLRFEVKELVDKQKSLAILESVKKVLK